MGMFRIQITGIGGHGVERHKEAGETVNFDAEGDWTVDAIARQIAIFAQNQFKSRGVDVDVQLIHWPGEDGQVVDNLLSGIRVSGSFNQVPESSFKVKNSVEVDATGLPLNPFDPSNYGE